MNKKMKFFLYLTAIALMCTFPGFMSKYLLHLIVYVMINSIAVLGLNILGSSGQISNAQAAFFGIGAYTAALLSLRLNASFWVYMLVVIVVTFIAGFLVGLPTMKVSGLYLIMTTMGINEIVYQVFKNWISLTNGPSGLNRIPAPVIFGFELKNVYSYYYLALVMFIIFVFLTSRIFKSRLGYFFTSIKNNSIAANMNGVNVNGIKLLAFAICSLFAGVAGALYASYISFISPENFTTNVSISFLTISIFGGNGSIPGVIIANAILTFATEYFRVIGEYRLVIYGVLLILAMIYMPNGIGGLLKKAAGYVRRKISDRRNKKAGGAE